MSEKKHLPPKLENIDQLPDNVQRAVYELITYMINRNAETQVFNFADVKDGDLNVGDFEVRITKL